MRRLKSPTVLIVLVPMLAMAIISIVYVAAYTRAAWDALPEIVSTMASEQIQGKISMGRVRISPGSIVFHDVVLTDEDTGARPILRAASVKIVYGLSELVLHRDDPIRGIEQIEVIRPRIFLERGDDGRWNVADLLKPSAARRPTRFRGRVLVKSGKLSMLDRKVPTAGRPGEVNELTDINALVDFSSNPVADCTITAVGKPGRVGKLSIRARYNLGNRSFNADLDALRANAAYWSRYPRELGFVELLSGQADFRLHVSGGVGDKPIRYSGVIRIHDGTARFAKIRSLLRRLNGEVRLGNDIASLELRGTLDSSPFSVSGRVLDFEQPRIAIDIKSDRANFGEISRLAAGDLPQKLMLPDPGKLNLSIFGPARSPSAAFKLEVPSLSFDGFGINALSVDGVYTGDRVVIQRAVGRVCGGSVEAAGQIRLAGEKSLALRGHVSGLRLAEIPLLERHEVDAVTSGDFEVSWAAHGGGGRYQGTLAKGTFRQIEFDEGAIAAEYAEGTLHVEELSAEVMGGKVAASGEVARDGTLSLQVSGANLNLATLQERYWTKPTVGKLQFVGKLVGALDNPAFEGQIEAYRVMVGGVSMERIAATLDATRDMLRVHELLIFDYPGKITISGIVSDPFARAPRLDLAVNAESLDAEKVALSLGVPVHTSGDLSAQLTVTNTFFDPRVEGSVHVEGGRIADMPFDAADVQVAYGRSRFDITSLTMRSGDAALEADGEIDLDGPRLQMAFEANGLPLATLTRALRGYAFVAGDVNVKGEIAGTPAKPEAHMTLHSDNLRLNGQSFGKMDADMSWTDGSLVVSRAVLSDGESEYSISRLLFSPRRRTLELGIETKHAQVQKLLALLDNSPQASTEDAPLRRFVGAIPRPLSGVLDVSLTGTISTADSGVQPDLHLQGSVSDLTLRVGHIQTVQFDGEWVGEVLRLNKLEALDGDTNVFAEAALGPSDQLALKLDAHGLALETMAQWFDLRENFSGTADVTIVASGSTKSPSVEAYLEIVDPVIAGVEFDRLRSRLSAGSSGDGQPPADDNRINIDEITLVLGDSDLRATGFLPVDWQRLTVPGDGQVRVEMALDNTSLELLSAFAGNVFQGGARGTLTGSVALSGTIMDPSLEGGLTWRDGEVHLARLNKPLEGIEAEVALSGHTLLVRRIAGRSAEGGRFVVTGAVDLTELKPKLDLTLETADMNISGRNVSGAYGEVIQARFDSALKVTGDWRKPRISGDIGIPRGRVEMAGQPSERRDAGRAPAFDPSFDIRVSLGRDVVLKTARLEAPLYGYLTLAGSMSGPAIEATVDVADGTILFPTRSFRILPGSDMWLRFSPPQPAVVMLDVRARARMTAASAFGKRKRYVITMEAKGPLDRLRPTFTASPPDLSEQRIIALITGQHQLERIFARDASQDVGKELSGLFSSAVMPTVFEPLEEAVEEALGFEEFALELGYREPLQLSISDHLWGGLLLSYTASLGARPDYADSLYELKLSYRFRNSLEIGILTDENSEIGVAAEGRIRF